MFDHDKVLASIESMDAGQADPERLLESAGQGFRSLAASPAYKLRLIEANEFIADCAHGVRRPRHWETFGVNLQEALDSTDFQVLFGDILDRDLLMRYTTADKSWPAYARQRQVRDFRPIKSFAITGPTGTLPKKKEDAEFEEAQLDDATPYLLSVDIYGENVPVSFKTIMNDDLGVLDQIPQDLADAAINTEEMTVTKMFVGTTGPKTPFFSSGNSNLLTGNPVLNYVNLKAALIDLMTQKDPKGMPIVIKNITLVVPPYLYIDAVQLVSAVSVELGTLNDTQRLVGANPLTKMVNVVQNYMIPIVASSANGHTSWFLFADPATNRPALQVAFLRGFAQPAIYMKAPNRLRLDGGQADGRMGDFETMTTRYQIVHILGTGTVDPRMARGSSGAGS